MAVGMDRSVRSTAPQPLRPSNPAPMQATPSYAPRPPAIADSAVQGAVNNQMAAGYGAGQMALKDSDRRGMSRGRGQQYYANIAQEAADAKAQAGAAQTEMGAAAANAAADLQYQNTMRGEQLANANLLEGLRNSQVTEQLSKNSGAQQLYEAYRRGQFGLDSMQLDYTPLLGGLFN